MSTIAPTQPMAMPVDPVDRGWVPSPLYRMSLEKYEAMVASGAFTARDRFHLINGYLVEKMTQHDPHCTADDLCGEALGGTIPAGWYVRPSKPIRLPAQASKPEPDRCVVRGSIRDYSQRTPGAADVAMVVEVADSSLAEDRKMAAIYGGPASRFTGSSTWLTTRSRSTPIRVRGATPTGRLPAGPADPGRDRRPGGRTDRG